MRTLSRWGTVPVQSFAQPPAPGDTSASRLPFQHWKPTTFTAVAGHPTVPAAA
jgi:hypothetical protein